MRVLRGPMVFWGHVALRVSARRCVSPALDSGCSRSSRSGAYRSRFASNGDAEPRQCRRFDPAPFGEPFPSDHVLPWTFRSLAGSLLLEILPRSHDGLGPEAEVTEGPRSTVDGHEESVGPRGLKQTETSTESISAPGRGARPPGGLCQG